MKALLILMLVPVCGWPQSAAALAEGHWRQRRWEEANQAFRAAVEADKNNPALKVRWGLLLLERFNTADAAGLFEEALAVRKDYPPALLGLARVHAQSYDQRAVALARAALVADPANPEARELLANLLLEDGAAGEAASEARQAGDSKMAQSVLAAIELLADRPAADALSRIGAFAPGYASIARHFVLNRRYDEAIAYYRKAIEIDPSLDRARSELGINLMRTGQDTEARHMLELAYEAGFRDAATANSLKLLDSYKNFEVIRRPRFVLRLHRSEAALLRPYFEREVLRALEAYDRKYALRLPGPVTVEVYPDHEDFAVRTMGLPGLGALGVTFGLSVAMDSPSARKPGSFHWASTLWHELSHVYALTATRHRVPRWFTEGLAVHEETAADPEWGDRLTPEILSAIREKKLLPVAKLDRGFIRPSFPSQVVVSYFQAGRICDFIEGRWGWAKLMAMLAAFSEVTETPAVVERVLGITPERFDTEFLDWLKASHAAPLAAFDQWRGQMKALNAAVRSKSWPDVAALAPRMIEAYPDYVEAGSAYEALASARVQTGDIAGAGKALDLYARRGGRDPELLKLLAVHLEKSGDAAGAERALSRLLWIYPVRDEDLHRRLAAARSRLGMWEGAIEEWRAVLESRTVDRASAWYEMAIAFRGWNRRAEARDAVMAALEEAPGYRPAQRLLLELVDSNKEDRK